MIGTVVLLENVASEHNTENNEDSQLSAHLQFKTVSIDTANVHSY